MSSFKHLFAKQKLVYSLFLFFQWGSHFIFLMFPVTSLFITLSKYPRRFRITSVPEKKQMFKHSQNWAGGGRVTLPRILETGLWIFTFLFFCREAQELLSISASM